MAISEAEVISLANAILVHVGLPRRVETLKQCNSTLFSQLYEALTGCRVPGLALQAPTSEAVKCQGVIDALNEHLFPHVRLDHIHGVDVARLDTISVKNLLDIFSVLFHIPPATADNGSDVDDQGGYVSYSDDSSDCALEVGGQRNEVANDSNMISSEGMSVISEVLREELGHRSHSNVTDSTTELLMPVPAARLPSGVLKPTARHTQVHPPHTQLQHKDASSSESQSNETSTIHSQPPSLTISSLHSTSTEGSSYDRRVLSQVRETQQDAASLTAAGRDRETAVNAKVNDAKASPLFIPSGESSIGTTPSPNLHTPPQSPQQRRQLSPLHHSTPHTSTRSRLFPLSSSMSTTATASTSCSHPLGVATVTPSVTVARQHTRAESGVRSSDKEREKSLPHVERSALSTVTTDESTLVPGSSPSPPRCSRQLPPPELSVTDLHSTTMSSGRGGRDEGVAGEQRGIHHGRSLDDSDSSGSETPPPLRERRSPQTAHPICTCTSSSSRATTAAQKVRFSQSTEQRDRARNTTDFYTTKQLDQSGLEVGGPSSTQLQLSSNAWDSQTRASILATLYQNYVKEMKTAARPAASEERKRTTSKSRGGGGKGTASRLKVKPHSRPMSKVASSKHRKYSSTKKLNKMATVKSHPLPPQPRDVVGESSSEKESSDEDSDSKHEERPPTPTQIAVGDNLLPLIERDFPFIHVSPPTAHRLLRKQLQQVTALTRSKVRQRTSAVKKMAEMEQKQKALLQIIKKELDHTKRMQRQLEQKREKVAVKSNVHAKRQAAARARRYYHDYELRLKAKLQQRRTREEQIFRRTFEEGLELQRERIRELKRYAKEKQEEHAKKHQDQLDSMENYYRDQLALLSESMLNERKESAIRDKAQHQMVDKMKRELRQKIESEIKELQKCIDRDEDVAHFRELDAQTVRHKLSRMTFTAAVK